jgi:hypothetical protein
MRTPWLIVVAAILTYGGTARADDAAAAEAMFQRGKTHMDAMRYAEACADFAVSESLDSSVGTLLNLGECNVKLGKTASSWAAFAKAAVKAEREGQLRRMEYAKQRASDVEPLMTRLEVRVLGERPVGMKITREREGMRKPDDMSLLVGSPVPVDPGAYLIVATAPAYKRWEEQVEIVGEGQTVVVEVPVLEASPVEATPEGTTPGSSTLIMQAPRKDPGANRRLIALGVGGVGIAAVTTGFIFGALANSDLGKSESHCDDDNLCDQAGVDLVADAKSSANISTVLVSLGGAALLAGGVLWFTAPSSSEKAHTSGLQTVPLMGPDQVGFAVRGGF